MSIHVYCTQKKNTVNNSPLIIQSGKDDIPPGTQVLKSEYEIQENVDINYEAATSLCERIERNIDKCVTLSNFNRLAKD